MFRSAHPRPWHRDSVFGEGPRRPLDRERKARWRYLVHAHTRAGRITPKGEWVLDELMGYLSRDGRCDPSYERLAAGQAFSAKTAERGIRDASDCSLLRWQRRIVRVGSRVRQTSNAYELLIPGDAEPHPKPPATQLSRAINLESTSISPLSIATISSGPRPGFDPWMKDKIAEEKRLRRLRNGQR